MGMPREVVLLLGILAGRRQLQLLNHACLHFKQKFSFQLKLAILGSLARNGTLHKEEMLRNCMQHLLRTVCEDYSMRRYRR